MDRGLRTADISPRLQRLRFCVCRQACGKFVISYAKSQHTDHVGVGLNSGEICILNSSSFGKIAVFDPHALPIRCITFLPPQPSGDLKIVTASFDKYAAFITSPPVKREGTISSSYSKGLSVNLIMLILAFVVAMFAYLIAKMY